MLPDDLYDQVWRVIPIACVDLIVTSADHQLLLVMRRNPPAKGQWWFPGGRVHHGETRAIAAVRKLREECGILAREVRELGTYDVILPMDSGAPARHGITTVFGISLAEPASAVVDVQSSKAGWRSFGEWAREDLHPFVSSRIREYVPDVP